MRDPAENDSPRNPSRGPWWLVIALVVLGLFLLVRMRPVRQGGDREVEPEFLALPLPDLRLAPLVGTEESLTLDALRGKVVLVNFWGTWCPPCRLEFPHLLALREELLAQPDFRLVLVSCTPEPQEDLESLREQTASFLVEMKVRVPVHADPDSATRKAVIAMLRAAAEAGPEMPAGIGYPTTLLLDRKGIVRAFWRGYGDELPEQISRAVRRLLAEK